MTEIVVHELVTVTADEAGRLETEFLNGLDQAQDAFEQIMDTNAWAALGHDSFLSWWGKRVVPVMRALSMRPTLEIAKAAIERARNEEERLPSAQRHTNAELADMFGASDWTVRGRQDQRERRTAAPADLEAEPAGDQPDGDPAEEPAPGLDDGTEDTPESEAGGVAAPSAGASSPPVSTGRGDRAPEPATPVPGSGAPNGNGRAEPPPEDPAEKERAHAARVSDDLRRLVILAQSFGTPELRQRAVELYDDKLGNAPMPPRGRMDAETLWKASEAVSDLAATWEERQ